MVDFNLIQGVYDMEIDEKRLAFGLAGLLDSAWLVDLDNDRIDILLDKSKPQLQGRCMSYRDFYMGYAKLSANPERAYDWYDVFSPDSLRETAEKGTRILEIYDSVYFEAIWYNLCVSPIGYEKSKSVFMITGRDVSAEKHDTIIANAVEKSYDYIVHLDLLKNTFVMYRGNPDDDAVMPPENGDNYDEEIIRYNRGYIADYDLDRTNINFMRQNIMQELDEKDSFEFFCDCIEAGKTRTKVIRMTYLDRESGIVLIMGTDITKDRDERRHALSIALSRTTIHEFCYYIKENRCELPQRTMRKYNFKKVYTDLPYSIMKDFVFEEDWEKFETSYNDIITHQKKTSKCIFRNKTGDIWLKHTLSVVPADGKESNIAVGIIEDITEQKKMEYRAQRDQLTGLYNKVSALSAIQHILRRYKESAHVMFVLDIDNFKKVNDIYGHSTGDEVLVKISNVLKTFFRSDDIIARFGGDEFIVFIQNVNDKRVILSKAEMIIESIREDVGSDYKEAQVTTSIGIAYSEGGMNVGNIFECADSALYEAKQKGKNRYCVAKSNHPKLKNRERSRVEHSLIGTL